MKVSKVSNLSILSGVLKNRRSLIDYIQNLRQDYGEVMRFSFGSMNGLFINNPELVKAIMVDKWSNYPKSRRYLTLSPLIGQSMIVSNGEKWKERRVLAQPIFQTRIMASYREIIQQVAREVIGKLKVGEVIDAYEVTATFTFKVISQILFSHDIDEYYDEFHHTVLKLQNECMVVTLYPFPVMDKLPLPANIKFKKLCGNIHSIVDKIIDRRIKDPKRFTYKDFLSRYLEQIEKEKKDFSPVELRNELVTLLIGGNETTALTLSWALYELSRPVNIPHLSRLSEEMERLEVPQGNEEAFAYMNAQKVLSNTINETLRSYPATWLVSREAASNDDLLGVPVKKGTLIIISPYFLHRHPEHWKSPEVWNPERFDDSINEDAFIPFAKGPRQCIGKPLAMFEMQIFLAEFLRSFDFSLNDRHEVLPRPLVNLYPDRPIKIVLKSLE